MEGESGGAQISRREGGREGGREEMEGEREIT